MGRGVFPKEGRSKNQKKVIVVTILVFVIDVYSGYSTREEPYSFLFNGVIYPSLGFKEATIISKRGCSTVVMVTGSILIFLKNELKDDSSELLSSSYSHVPSSIEVVLD